MVMDTPNPTDPPELMATSSSSTSTSSTPSAPLPSAPVPVSEGGSDDTGKEGKEGDPKSEREKKVKVALILMYLGFDYQGLQFNPGAHTIEAELHQALIKAGCVGEDNQGAMWLLDDCLMVIV